MILTLGPLAAGVLRQLKHTEQPPAPKPALRVPVEMLEGFRYPADSPEQEAVNAEIRKRVRAFVESAGKPVDK